MLEDYVSFIINIGPIELNIQYKSNKNVITIKYNSIS